MSSNKSSIFLPEKFLTDPKTSSFYTTATDVFDQALELSYYSEIEKLKNLYNPSSEFYDTDYILNLLGEDTLKNLLSDVTDKISLTMILSGIQNIKGTKKAFYAILKLLKLNYKSIIFRTLDNGCTEVTIVFDRGERINVNDIALLDKFAQEVFPLCLTLAGVTNCTTYEISNIYNGFNTVDLGVHYLDKSFILDMSNLDTSYGIIDKSISSTIAMLICNNTSSSFTVPTITMDNLRGHNTSSYLNYGRGSQVLLDRSLFLDRFNPVAYYGFDVAHGKALSSYFVYTNNNFATDTIRLDSKFIFRLDTTLMDMSAFEPMDGIPKVITNIKSLDRGFTLGSTQFDRASQTVTTVNNPRIRKASTITLDLTDKNISFSNKISSQKVRLDYEYSSASTYLPMLNI